mmetsp:Transcript_38053/g.56942  ORF Transcript_38053/g.56942 Transcript_38053/m.56942 type:complete len:90 (-) Transcript_38053:405-674(-)
MEATAVVVMVLLSTAFKAVFGFIDDDAILNDTCLCAAWHRRFRRSICHGLWFCVLCRYVVSRDDVAIVVVLSAYNVRRKMNWSDFCAYF